MQIFYNGFPERPLLWLGSLLHVVACVGNITTTFISNDFQLKSYLIKVTDVIVLNLS